MIRSRFIALWCGTACILLGIAGTGHQVLFGSLVGYWVGFIYTEWIRRETLRSSELDVNSALKRMRRNLVSRLGMVTLVVVVVARFRTSWLLSLAVGIAIGVIVSFITVAIHRINEERSDKRSA